MHESITGTMLLKRPKRLGTSTRVTYPKILTEIVLDYYLRCPLTPSNGTRITTRSPKYNFNLLLLQKYLSNRDVYIIL
jgi:hypothetical protein